MAYTTINKPEDYFKPVLYTGTHSSVPTVTVGFKSDFLWLKSRTQTYDHNLLDTTRGGTKKIFSNKSDAESSTGDSVTFNATTFQPSGQAINESGQGTNNMISWSWKANGGTTASNTDGSITSTVQANTTAGFSIVTWTGTTSNGTVGHGLGKAPDCIFFKNYAAAENWTTYHSVLGNSGGMYLNLTNSFNTASSWYQDQSPTSDYFYVGTNTKTNGGSMIAYCFADTPGYSKFGKYTGNANADGPFIYTGFKPAWIMLKKTSGTSVWGMLDNKRVGYNVDNNQLYAEQNGTEGTGDILDIVSNGFKFRSTDSSYNESGGTFIYMAFAQNPLVATNDVIALAR
jgi:hypothetical protein